MRKPLFDPAAKKKAVSISLNSGLLAETLAPMDLQAMEAAQ